ncbi:MAG: hypothetical protein PHE33_09035 [Bacteroidales bacterium]|nr:hypothetical protein [Bacteroidales bacterium]
MKKLALLNIVFVTILCVFSSCKREGSSDVNQDRIHVVYEMAYNKATDITYAMTTFFFGSIIGTRLELSNPSKVTCNDELLSFESVLANYVKQYTGFIDTGSFKFTDTDGKTFVNMVYIKEVGFPENIDTIIKGSSFKLDFIGEPLAQGESVYAHIAGLSENVSISVYQNTFGATSIIIPANETSKLSVGTFNLYLRRRTETTPQEKSSAGASCTGTYTTNEVKIEVID